MLNLKSGYFRDRLLAQIYDETICAYNEGLYLSAISTFFILIEQSLKKTIGLNKGNIHKIIIDLHNSKRIEEEVAILLLEFKYIRNKIFHEENYSWGFMEDGIWNSLSEVCVQREIFEFYFNELINSIPHSFSGINNNGENNPIKFDESKTKKQSFNLLKITSNEYAEMHGIPKSCNWDEISDKEKFSLIGSGQDVNFLAAILKSIHETDVFDKK